MAEEIDLGGKRYVSSKRASQMSGYTQDYIGQLARAGNIDAKRVGGLWYISYDSIEAHKRKAEEYVPHPPVTHRAESDDMDSFVGLDGRDYISSGRASDISGYSQDYIGQLARGGQVTARQVGNRWYVERGTLLAHKHEKDSLLAAVQAESVGLGIQTSFSGDSSQDVGSPMLMKYSSENGMLTPRIIRHTEDDEENGDITDHRSATHPLPIRIVRTPASTGGHVPEFTPSSLPSKDARHGPLSAARMLGAIATIVVLITFGFASIRSQSSYTSNITPHTSSLTALSAEAAHSIGDALELWLTDELIYRRK